MDMEGHMTVSPEVTTGTAKADLGKRFIAVLIDAIPAIIVSAVLGRIPFLGSIAAGLLAGIWWLVRDGLNLAHADLRSPGKRLMGLRPVRLDGQPMTLRTSMRRNVTLAAYSVGFLFWVVPVLGWIASLPVFALGGVISLVEVVLVLTDAEGRRMGDKLAATKVVEAA
jgi:uncharacterized RDD family membrane protein YckC